MKLQNLGLALLCCALIGCTSKLLTGPVSYFEGIPAVGQKVQNQDYAKEGPQDTLSQKFSDKKIMVRIETNTRPYSEDSEVVETYPAGRVNIMFLTGWSDATLNPALVVLEVVGVRHYPVKPKRESGKFSENTYRLKTQGYSNARVIFLPGAIKVNGQPIPQTSFRYEYARRHHSYRYSISS